MLIKGNRNELHAIVISPRKFVLVKRNPRFGSAPDGDMQPKWFLFVQINRYVRGQSSFPPTGTHKILRLNPRSRYLPSVFQTIAACSKLAGLIVTRRFSCLPRSSASEHQWRTWGGSAIKQDIIAAPGLRLEFGNRVLTTPIRHVRLIRAQVNGLYPTTVGQFPNEKRGTNRGTD